MKILIDPRSDIPIYLQIVEQVRNQVVSGEIKPGDQLPTVRSLASDLRINFNTVSRSYRLLDEAGIISTQQGRGTYILEMPSIDATEKLRLESLEAITNQYLEHAQKLGFDIEEIIKYIQQK